MVVGGLGAGVWGTLPGGGGGGARWGGGGDGLVYGVIYGHMFNLFVGFA